MSILDNGYEKHDGPEPRVLAQDVREILAFAVKPDSDDGGVPVTTIAEKANVSTRTVYRVLSGDKPSLGLDLADRLCLAAGSHLANCRLVWPDGTITPYF